MIFGATITLVIVLLAMQVSASVSTKNAVVTYSDIKVNIDGQPVTLTDLEGREVEPIMLFDTVYVPLSPVARAFGKASTYDDKSKTVFIGKTPDKVTYMFDILKAYETYVYSFNGDIQENVSFKMLGESYTHGIIFISGPRANSCGASYYLKGQYKTIKGVLGRVDGNNPSKGTLSIYLDDNLYKEYDLSAGMMPTNITVDVTGVQRIKFIISAEQDFSGYCIGNVTIE